MTKNLHVNEKNCILSYKNILQHKSNEFCHVNYEKSKI